MPQRGSVPVVPVGPVINNGFDVGGARNYPWSVGLAIQPNAQFSRYIGSANGNPIIPPAAALAGTTGNIGAGLDVGDSDAISNPFGAHSPLPWVVGGLLLALVVMYKKGYSA